MLSDAAMKDLHITSDGKGGSLLAVKVVPAAARDELAGALAERLKVRVAAAAEGGKANAAVCAIIAATAGVNQRDVSVVQGLTAPMKTVRIAGVLPNEVRERLSK